MSLPVSPQPHSPQPPPELREFPSYRPQDFLPSFLLGWLLGAGLTFLVRLLGQQALSDPCRGQTLLALAIPLLLGPGGLAFTALNWRSPSRAALGLGLVIASLLPGLFVGARDIGHLRTIGCAGGYLVFSTPGSKSITSLMILQGQTREIVARLGGFPKNDLDLFTLKTASPHPGLSLKLGKTQLRAGESVPLTISVAPGTPINTYTVGLQASGHKGGKTVGADATLTIDVRP